MINRALQYLKQGFSVVPIIPGEKKVYVSWKEFQKRLPTEQEIRDWWRRYPSANIALTTGLISGISMIDVDSQEGLSHVKPYIPNSLIFPTADTLGGGEHWYFRCLDSDLQTQAPIDGSVYFWFVPCGRLVNLVCWRFLLE